MRRDARSLLALSGFVAVVPRLWGGIPLVRDIVNEAQGKCDYLPCAGPGRCLPLPAFGALVMSGAILLTWAVFRRSGLLRKHGREFPSAGS